MVYQPSQNGDIDYASHTKQVLKMIQKEDCAGNDLDFMKGIVKEIAVLQKLSKPMYEATGEAYANSSIFNDLDFTKGIVKEMAGTQNANVQTPEHHQVARSLQLTISHLAATR